jgi:transketolase
MRHAFATTLAEMATEDPRILLLTGDLGYMALEPFADAHPGRFLNVGVAEQNLVGLATGLAEAGMVPFVYSIVTFAVLRPYEFLRNGPVLQRLPVRVVGVGGGFEYWPGGHSHHGLEDIGVTRLQPGLTVVAPADHEQLRSAMRATRDLTGPVFFRIGKDDKTTIPGLNGRFALGRAEELRDGTDTLIVTTGAIAVEAVAAADLLAARGISCAVALVASIAPAPVADLVRLLGRFPVAVAVEAHYATSGLGSLVCEIVAEHAIPCRVVRRGVNPAPGGHVGSQAYLQRQSGLSRDALAREIETVVGAPARVRGGA